MRELDVLRVSSPGLEKKKTKTDDDRKEIEAIRKSFVRPPVQPTPALAEVAWRSPSAPRRPGPRQLRLKAKTGMSNPVVFLVGQLPELTSKKWSSGRRHPPGRGTSR
ncbi:MAG: hypothetical protein U0793_30080 [Gemmataceae bacterium]